MEITLLLRAVFSLLVIIALIYGLSYLLRHFKNPFFSFLPSPQNTRLKIIERLRLADKRELLLIQKDQTEFLIVMDGGAVRLLEKGELHA